MKSLLAKALSTLLLSAAVVQAQTTFQWDPSGLGGNGSDVSGTWDAGTTADWTQGSTTKVVWGNSTSDIANFGSTGTASNVTVTVSGTVNAAEINFDNTSKSYTIQNGTINGPASGTFTINVANGDFFINDSLLSDNFTGASTYQFVGSSTNQGQGMGWNGTTKFNGNVVLGLLPETGTGTIDQGEIGLGATKYATGTITINRGWSIYNSSGGIETDTFVLDGLGSRDNGTLSMSGNNSGYSGAVTLAADATFGAGSASSTSDTFQYVTGTISSAPSTTDNLTLGFWNSQSSSTGLSKLIVGSSTSASSYTGATVIINAYNALQNGTGVAAQKQRVALGFNNALPSTTTLVIGANGSTAEVAGANPLTSQNSGISNGDMIGVFDLNSHNLSVAGLTTGAGMSSADAALNIVGNSGNATSTVAGTGNAVLTINGGTSGTQASTYAGIIQNNFASSGATTDATETSTFGLAVTGGSETLTGVNNTYSGGTAVSGTGTLVVNNASGSATGVGPVTVSGASSSAYGVLAGGTPGSAKAKTGSATSFFYVSGGTTSNSGADSTGYIVGSGVNGVSINSGGHLAPGVAGIGTITVGDLTLNSGAVVDYEYDGSANDFTAVNGAFTLAGPTTFNLYQAGTTSAVTTTGVYDLFSYGSLGTPFLASNLTMGDPTAGLAYTFVNDTNDKLIQLDITTAATPEPSTWAMLLGGVALLGFVIRRRSFNS